MKRLLLVILVGVLPVSAQWRHFGGSSTRVTGFFGAGVSAPTNPLATRLDPGWNIAGGIGVVRGPVGVTVDALYTGFGINREALMGTGARDGSQKFFALTVDPIVHVNDRGPVDFYLTGGGGLYARNTKFEGAADFYGGDYGRYDVIRSRTLYKPGVNGGAGFAFTIDDRSNMKLFIEARYHHMFTHGVGASFIPITVGIRF